MNNKNNEKIMEQFVNDTETGFENPPAKITPVQSRKVSNKDVESEAENLRKEGKLDYLGWQSLNVNSLPTKGMFYPEGTKIYVRAATGGEVKHWSTMNVEDVISIDDTLNYVIEKCCKISIPGNEHIGGNWKDLIDVDRLYILLAIRDFTWPAGENELTIPISETENLTLLKDNIDYITFPDELLKYYNDVDRCFTLRFKTGKVINLYLTSLGVSSWLKNYVQQKQNSKEQYDKDFLLYAPLLIKNYRKLSTRAYEELVENSNNWSINEWSVISHFRDLLLNSTSEPNVVYTDANGLEHKIPLTFRGGIKSIFLVSDSLSFLD